MQQNILMRKYNTNLSYFNHYNKTKSHKHNSNNGL